MTIQLSVTIWTVICFIALYFILKFLLFKPILTVMDKRKEKIKNAEREKESALCRKEKQKELLEQKKQEMIIEAKKAQDIEADKLRADGKKMLENAKKECISYVNDFNSKTESEILKDMEKAEDFIDKSAELFIQRIFAK